MESGEQCFILVQNGGVVCPSGSFPYPLTIAPHQDPPCPAPQASPLHFPWGQELVCVHGFDISTGISQLLCGCP